MSFYNSSLKTTFLPLYNYLTLNLLPALPGSEAIDIINTMLQLAHTNPHQSGHARRETVTSTRDFRSNIPPDVQCVFENCGFLLHAAFAFF